MRENEETNFGKEKTHLDKTKKHVGIFLKKYKCFVNNLMSTQIFLFCLEVVFRFLAILFVY